MLQKENEWFKYTIVNDRPNEKEYIRIEEYKKDDAMVEIPSEIDGVPVKELAGYVLSEKSCEQVFLPESVSKVGNYCFYNCRKLWRLSFGSALMDLGSGLFTGCHHIQRLDIWMEKEETCLKEILLEVPEELCVYMHGIFDAVLWFPEFFEEGIENTPARNLSVQVHGSGIFYRNCFQGKILQFSEYDKRFEMACALENEKLLTELVYGRLSVPQRLSEENKERYEQYLNKYRTEMIEQFIRERREEELEWLLRTYPYEKAQRADYEYVLRIASECDIPSVISILMEYGRIHFPPEKKKFEL